MAPSKKIIMIPPQQHNNEIIDVLIVLHKIMSNQSFAQSYGWQTIGLK